MQLYGYIRVSTSKEEQRTSIKSQHRMMIDEGVLEENIFIDHGVSGWKKIKRRGFENCLDACRDAAANGEEVTLYISNDKRFGRLAAQGMMQLEDLEKSGVKVFDLLSHRHMSVIGDEFFETGLKLLLAQQESQRLSQLQLRNYEQRRAQGRAMGGKPPAGYRRHPDDKGKLEPIPEYREALQELIQWAAEGVSLYEIAKRVRGSDVLSQAFKKRKGADPLLRDTTIRGWLNNPILRGHIFYKKDNAIIHQKYECHEAIMTEVQYRAVLHHYQNNQENLARWGHNRKHPISARYLRCDVCGGRCIIQRSGAGTPWVQKYARCRKQNNCDHRTGTKLATVEQAIQQKLAEQASDMAKIVVQPQVDEVAQQKIIALERELDEAKAMALRSKRKGAQALVDEIEAELRTKRHRAHQTQPVNLDEYRHYFDLLKDPETLSYLDVDERHEVYCALISKVLILDGGVAEVLTIWG